MQGYTGPLCGSCNSSYGSSPSSKCQKCRVEIDNVLVICVSAVILLFLSGITMKGTLYTTNRQRMMVSGHRRISRGIQLSNLSTRNLAESPRAEDPPVRSDEVEGTNASTGMAHVTEATLAEWRVTEMLKVRPSCTRPFLTGTVIADNAELHPSDSTDCISKRWMDISCS